MWRHELFRSHFRSIPMSFVDWIPSPHSCQFFNTCLFHLWLYCACCKNSVMLVIPAHLLQIVSLPFVWFPWPIEIKFALSASDCTNDDTADIPRLEGHRCPFQPYIHPVLRRQYANFATYLFLYINEPINIPVARFLATTAVEIHEFACSDFGGIFPSKKVKFFNYLLSDIVQIRCVQTPWFKAIRT